MLKMLFCTFMIYRKCILPDQQFLTRTNVYHSSCKKSLTNISIFLIFFILRYVLICYQKINRKNRKPWIELLIQIFNLFWECNYRKSISIRYSRVLLWNEQLSSAKGYDFFQLFSRLNDCNVSSKTDEACTIVKVVWNSI